MAGAGIYYVGLDGDYDSLQTAVDQLVSDQGAPDFTALQEIVITDDRSYAGVSIPETLNPTSTFRLVLKSAADANPVISGKVDPLNAWIGIAVDRVPYVTVESLKIRDFRSAGVLFNGLDGDADYGRVIACDLIENGYYGVQFFSADRGIVFNTSAQGSSALISHLRSRELVLVHNSLSNSGTNIHNARLGKHCLWAEFYPEIEQKLLDPTIPIYYAINNVFVTDRGVAPVIMEMDVEKTLTTLNGNVYYSNIENAAVTLTQIVDGRRVDTNLGLTEWQRITGQEADSHFANPEFVTTPTGQPAPGLVLEDGSPVVNMGIPPADWGLPAWVDLAIFGNDPSGNPRDPVTPSPGAPSYPTNPDYDFIGFIEGTSDFSTSELTIGGVDRAVRQLQRSMDCWYPKVAAGYFYIGDAAFYLYADKLSSSLSSLSYSKVELPERMDVSTVRIGDTSSQEDLDMTEVTWFQVGQTVWANWGTSAEVSLPAVESVRVYGTEWEWQSSEQAFDQQQRSHTFPIKENPVEFYFDECPMDGAPIVITDDSLTMTPERGVIPFEYNMAWSRPLQRMQLHLETATNIVENPHFGASFSGWESAISGSWALDSDRPLVGEFAFRVITDTSEPVDSFIFKKDMYRQDLEKDLVVSFHVHNSGSGTYIPTIRTYEDDNTTVFSEQDVGEFTLAGATSDLTYERYAIMCKAHADSALSPHSAPYTESFVADLRTVDRATSKRVQLEIRVKNLQPVPPIAANGTSEWDAFMGFEGDYLPAYAGLTHPSVPTVEWEGSEGQLYAVQDLSISPILNPQHSGFLTISNVPISSIETSYAGDSTTLSDDYPTARLGLLPWARVDGPGKYRAVESQVFSMDTRSLPYEVGFLPETSSPFRIEARPDTLTVGQGLQGTMTAFVSDKYNNPMPYEDVTFTLATPNGRFPGLLGLRELSVPSKLNSTLTVRTDPSGAAVVTVLAPEVGDVVMGLETSEVVGDRFKPIYEPDTTNHGNATMNVVLSNAVVTTVGAQTSEDIALTQDGEAYYANFLRIPKFGTVTAHVPGTSAFDLGLSESLNSGITDEEFYVDYGTGRVYTTNAHTNNIRVGYQPRLIWVDSAEPEYFQVDPSLASLMTSDIIVQHDAVGSLTATIGARSVTVPVTYRNPEL